MRLILVFLSVTHLLGCRSTNVTSVGKTDLVDNAAVAATYRSYVETNDHCEAREGRKRALITGFGLFGSPHNISGIVAMSMVKPGFFPAQVELNEPPQVAVDQVWGHKEAVTRNGGSVSQRTLTIDGEAYDICALYLDVQWDLAAAIILYEATLFKPDLVIMSGMNGGEARTTLFESGAINKAKQNAGFGPTGAQTPNNLPVDHNTPVLPYMPVGQTVALTWDAFALVNANRSLIESISPLHNYTVDVGYARASNNYICNNVSLAVSEALRGRSISLAGGQIIIDGQDFGAKVGFLHYPFLASKPQNADSGQQIYGWTLVLANTIKHGI